VSPCGIVASLNCSKFTSINSHHILISEIKEEAADTRAEVKTFDHSKLKHVETEEKNKLPKQSGKCALF